MRGKNLKCTCITYVTSQAPDKNSVHDFLSLVRNGYLGKKSRENHTQLTQFRCGWHKVA